MTPASTYALFVMRARGPVVWMFALLVFGVDWTVRIASFQQDAGTAEDVAASLMLPIPGMSVDSWKARTPGATWQRYRGTLEDIERLATSDPAPRGIEPGGFWCAVATDHSRGIERAVVFYGLRDMSPPACRIELVHDVVRGTSEGETAKLFHDLTGVITKRVGVSATAVDVMGRSTPVPYGGATGYPEGVRRWEEGVGWHQDDRDVFLFRAAQAVGFSSRSLLLTSGSEDTGGPNDVARDAERRLGDALRERFPDASAAMPYKFVPQHQAEIRRGLIQVLDARGAAAAEDQALLTFAADRLARKLWVEPPGPPQHRELAPLLRRGLRFVDQPDSDLSVYNGALISVVLNKWPETAWGQLAFVTRLYEGWSEGCDGGAFVHVIRQGDTWLRSHPDSPSRIGVLTAVARAYETKWALNGTFTTDARENARVVTAAAAAARIRAIRLYDELMQLAPQSQDAAYARRRIIQIRANMTTSQDAYSCVIP